LLVSGGTWELFIKIFYAEVGFGVRLFMYNMKIPNTFFNRSRTVCLTLFAGAILLPLYLLSAQGTQPGSAAAYTRVDISDTVTIGPVINVKQITSSSTAPAGAADREFHPNRFPRLRPPIQESAPELDQILATPLTEAGDAAHAFFRGFTGLTHRDQRLANGGNQFSHEPPDHGLAVGNGFVLQAVNSAINIYDTNGIVQLVRPLALTELFGLPPAIDRTTGEINTDPGDPSCLFDPETQRWFVVAWAQLNTRSGVPLRKSRLFLAVSQTSDPRENYSVYVFNTTDADDPDQQGPRVPDFPHFAVDRFGLYISTNEFKIDENGNLTDFIDVAITAISKNALLRGNGGRPPRRVQRFALPFTTGFEFTIWPAYIPPGQSPVLTNNGTQYFVSSQFVRFNENEVAVWALTNTSSLDTANPNLRLKQAIVQTRHYHFPRLTVTQPDGFHPLGASMNLPVPSLDPGDFRIVSAEFVGGHLWATLNSQMNDGSGNPIEAAVFFAFTPQITNGHLTASVFTQGAVGRPGVHLLYPAIALNTDNNGAMVFTLVGPDNFPSSAFVSIRGTTVSPIHISREGNEPEDGFTGYPPFSNGVARWGDYSGAAVDNLDNTIWMGTEYIPDIARTQFANWATYITRWSP
jgi:hypothetical protein